MARARSRWRTDRSTITRYRVKSAFLYHLPLGEIEVHVFDKENRGITNLLGTRSLRNIAVSFDNARKTVEISRRDER